MARLVAGGIDSRLVVFDDRLVLIGRHVPEPLHSVDVEIGSVPGNQPNQFNVSLGGISRAEANRYRKIVVLSTGRQREPSRRLALGF